MYKNIIDKIRKITPLWLRQKIGPLLGYFDYLFHINFRKVHIPKVLSLIETVKLIKKNNMSVIRFGDGEMSYMCNTELSFQNKNNLLAKNLEEILKTSEEGLLICIPGFWKNLNIFSKTSFWFIIHHLFKYRNNWINLLSSKQIYGDAYITRPYLGYKNKSHVREIFEELFEIWKSKNVVLIEGSKSRLGVGNNMFSKVKSLERILCPSENAYAKYEEIKKEATKIDKNKLILISLGPSAKVLAYDLFLLGYRVLDIGHIDMEYEMYLRNSDKLTKVEYKYFNEINERNPAECRDSQYLSQIIAKIE